MARGRLAGGGPPPTSKGFTGPGSTRNGLYRLVVAQRVLSRRNARVLTAAGAGLTVSGRRRVKRNKALSTRKLVSGKRFSFGDLAGVGRASHRQMAEVLPLFVPARDCPAGDFRGRAPGAVPGQPAPGCRRSAITRLTGNGQGRGATSFQQRGAVRPVDYVYLWVDGGFT